MNIFASDLAINSVKTLVDNCRCVNCTRSNQVRYRFSCGHSVCEVCIETYHICVRCSPTSSNSSAVIDKPQTKRVQHATELLNSFQNLFNIEVYRQQRLSEKLKAERKIFPHCIQAPIKYYNKRKNSIFIEKENKEWSFLPGENISYVSTKMEKSKNYVKQWLNDNENSFGNEKKSRLPLTSINTNTCNSNNLLKNNVGQATNRKRKLNKTASTTPTSTHIYKPLCKKNSNLQKSKCQHHESGIELDDDISFINDSCEIEDKDKLAQTIVQEAKECNSFNSELVYINKHLIHKPNNTFNLRKAHIENVPSTSKSLSTSPYKVPFYKKSILYDTCQLCAKANDKTMNNVTVTIDNPSFKTTIKISNNTKYIPKFKSVETQTHNDEVNKVNETDTNSFNKNVMDAGHYHNKEYLKKKSNDILNKAKCVVIDDSDCDSSDSEINREVLVVADIHRSCNYEDYVFKQLESCEYENRIIPRVRGNTPASSDSSDKENYNPNRKRQKLTSKIKKK